MEDLQKACVLLFIGGLGFYTTLQLHKKISSNLKRKQEFKKAKHIHSVSSFIKLKDTL